MATTDETTTWPGLRLSGPEKTLDRAAEIACAALAPEELLGTARQTWRAEDYRPASPEPGDAASLEWGRLEVYLNRSADVADCAARLERALAQALPKQANAELLLEPASTPDADWATSWKEFFRPVAVSPELLVLPAWWDVEAAIRELAPQAPRPLTIRIEPGRAFGSGTHATTRLSLRRLTEAARPGDRVLDFGAGSGILSIVAAARGAASVVAIEIDPDTAENFNLNTQLNDESIQSATIDHRIGSAETLRGDEAFDLIVCNALFHRVSPVLPAVASRLAAGGRFLYSGYLHAEEEAMRTFFEQELGLSVESTEREEEWGALVAWKDR